MTALLAEANPPGEMYPERFVLEENTFRRNRDAVLVPRAAASLRGNDAFRNSGQGIVAPNATDLGGNTARGNGVEPQCTGVTCGSGRVLDAATLSRRSAAPS